MEGLYLVILGVVMFTLIVLALVLIILFARSKLVPSGKVKININDEDAYETARKLAKEERIFVGMSSGAAMFVALQKVKEMKKGLVVVLLHDGGEKYLSTTLFSE